MRRIREARNLSVGDLHDETKIPTGLIETFEENALFNHPQFNRVYLRSFVRTYAQVVGIDADLAMAALEEALDERYTGSLAVEYLGEEPEEPAELRGAPAGAEEEEVAPEDESPTGTPPAAEAPEPRRAADEREPEDAAATPPVSPPVSRLEHEAGPVEEPTADDDWNAQSPPVGARTSARTGAAAPRYSDRGVDRRWLIVGIAILALAVVVWVLVSISNGPEPEVNPSVVDADTVESVDTASAPAVARPQIDVPALGDTMQVRIIASTEKVDPIRVTADDDLRRPYWIEQGDSMTFQPTDRIVIEDHLDVISLKIEGIEYPTDRRDEQGRIVITRDSVEAYFASLQEGA